MAGLEIGDELDGLTTEFESAQHFTQAFREELSRVQEELRATDREARGLSRSLGTGLKSAFVDLVFDGGRLTDVLLDIGRSMASSVFSSAIAPVQSALGSGIETLVNGAIGGLMGAMPFAAGGVVSAGRVRAFARGGIVGGPTLFPLRGGTGLMGEAGPEAIMPLARDAEGRLGVRGVAGTINVTVNVTTPDVEGFRRSQSQIAAGVSRALRQGQRNL